jgi:hypothetical protein
MPGRLHVKTMHSLVFDEVCLSRPVFAGNPARRQLLRRYGASYEVARVRSVPVPFCDKSLDTVKDDGFLGSADGAVDCCAIKDRAGQGKCIQAPMYA